MTKAEFLSARAQADYLKAHRVTRLKPGRAAGAFLAKHPGPNSRAGRLALVINATARADQKPR